MFLHSALLSFDSLLIEILSLHQVSLSAFNIEIV